MFTTENSILKIDVIPYIMFIDMQRNIEHIINGYFIVQVYFIEYVKSPNILPHKKIILRILSIVFENGNRLS